jgi:nucleoside-diphosphate-sugar epimerase
MMHVLFIGGTGLISTATARQLLAAGHRVTLYNRGRSENRLPEGVAYEVIRGDRKDYAGFEATFADKTYDVVVDMVAFHPDDSASAVRAFNGRCGQFLHCSTVCVYSGPTEQIPTTESEPYHSIGGYGKNKILCEQLLREAHEKHGFPVTILRPSHSYGEGGMLTRPFGRRETFIDRIRKGKPVIVPGDGTSLWTSCHVDDVARGFISTMGAGSCVGQAYHITGEEWVTWNRYHEIIAQVAGGSYEPVHVPTGTLSRCLPKLSGGTREIFAWPSVFTMDKLKRDALYPGQSIPFAEGAARNIAWMDANDKHADSGALDADDEDAFIAAWRAGQESLPVVAGS